MIDPEKLVESSDHRYTIRFAFVSFLLEVFAYRVSAINGFVLVYGIHQFIAKLSEIGGTFQ